MSWTSPATQTTGDLITAAIWNAQIPNNMSETAPAKATTAGDIFVATGANALKRLALGAANLLYKVNSAGTDVEAGQAVEASIADGAVTEAKIGTGAVTSSKLGALAVIAGKISDGAVDTLARIAASIRTTAGGTQASRLAVTNASGKVGAALVADSASSASSASSVPASGITGTISDAQHGNRGGGSLHLAATTSVAGFLSAADKTSLDELVSSASKIATGTYTGDDTTGRTITVGFTPKLVLVVGATGVFGMGMHSNGLYGLNASSSAGSGHMVNSDNNRPDPTTNGFIVDEANMNSSALDPYNWVAIG